MCVASTGATQASRYEILYRFGTNHNAFEIEAPVLVAGDGTIYGTTENYLGPHGRHHAGTIFALNTDGQESLLWHFTTRRHSYGTFPVGNLIADPGGALIGATRYGGSADHRVCDHGCGVVFSLQLGGSITILRTFGTASR